MLKRLLKDSATYGMGRIFAVLLGFATLPILTSHLSTAEYGIIDLLILCVTFFNLSVALEISQGVARFASAQTNPNNRSLYTSTALFFSIGMYAIAGSLIFIFQTDIHQLLFKDQPNTERLILFLIPWSILHGINYFVTNQLRWENRVWPYVILRTLNGLVMLIAIVVLLKKRKMGVEGVLFSYILSLAVTSAIGVGLLVYYKSLRPNFCKIKLKEMLSFSFPLVSSSSAVFVQNYIDRIMITNMLDLERLGLYSFAFKIASSVTLVSMSFQMSVTPLVYQLHKEKNTPLHIAEGFNIYLLSVLLTIVGISLFIPEFFHFFIGEEFYSSANLIPILCFSVILSGLAVFSPGLAIARKTKLIAVINLIGMLLNAVLNFICIKHYGLIGATIATTISLGATQVITFFVSSKYYPVPYLYSRMASGTAIAVTALFLIVFYQTLGVFSVIQLIVKIILYVFLSLLLFIVFIPLSRRT